MEEVDIVSETKQLKDYWQERDSQMDADRLMIHLTKDVAKTNEIKWYSNEPKVFYDTACALLSNYQPRFRMPLSMNFEPEEKDRMNKAERFVIGIFRALESRQVDRGQNAWLREMAYWLLSGWAAVFTIVVKDGDNVRFIADHFDPKTVYPEWDSEGMTKCVRTFEVDKRTAMSMVTDFMKKGLKAQFYEPANDVPIDIINYWRKDGTDIRNAIYIAGQEVKPLTVVKKLQEIPIHVFLVGVPEKGTDGWKTRTGENIIAANRDTYIYENQLWSLMATIMAETAYPNVITKTRSGNPPFKTEDMRGYGQNIPLRLDEQIELLKHASTPAETLQLLTLVAKQRQKASFADTTYGSVAPVEISGFALSQYMAALKYRLGPYLNMMQTAMGRIASDLLRQYKTGDFPAVQLSTSNPLEMKKGLFFIEEFTPQDVPEHLYIEVTIPLTTAVDKTQQILFARQALQPPALMSRETLWDELLDVQDSEQEYTRIIQDEMLETPIVKQIALIEQLRERASLYQSQGLIAQATVLLKYIAMLEMQIGMQPKPGGNGNNGGVSPDGMPPEMNPGQMNPDMQRAAMNIRPTGLSRPPMTPEQRAESKSAPARLLNSRGEPM